jgi:hypothetical protein
MTTPEEARRWLVDVAGFTARDNWEATVYVEPLCEGFVELGFTDKDGQVSALRERDHEVILALVLASLPSTK